MVKKRAYLAEDKERRRQDILAAAESLLANGALPSLAAIAQKAQIVKGTVYLYFSSKEEIYLAILGEGLRNLVTTILTDVAENSDIKSVIGAFCDFCVNHPKIVYLASISPVILENNIQLETAKGFKQELSTGLGMLGEAISTITGLAPDVAEKRFLYSYLMMISIFQQAHPPNVIVQAIDNCELHNIKVDFGQDLKNALYTMWGLDSD